MKDNQRIPHSKQYDLLLSRINGMYFQLDMIEASLDLVFTKIAHKQGTKAKLADVLELKKGYKYLDITIGNPANHINRAKVNNYQYILQSVYIFFGEYLRGILSEIYKTNPLLVVGKSHGTLQFQEIVNLGDYSAVSEIMIDKVFKKLEGQRSTKQLLCKVLEGTDVKIEDALLEKFLMYAELRHIIVHRVGKLDETFVNRYNHVVKTKVKVGSKIALTVGFVRDALDTTKKVLKTIDSQLVDKNAIKLS